VPRYDTAENKIGKPDKKRHRARFTDSAAAKTKKKVCYFRHFSLCHLREGRSARHGIDHRGIRLHRHTSESNYHKHARRDSGVYEVTADAPEKAFYNGYRENASDGALPKRYSGGEIKAEQKPRKRRAEIADSLLFFYDNIENSLRKHAACGANSYNEKRTKPENDRSHNGGGQKRDHNVAHYSRGGAAAVNMGRNRYTKKFSHF
jgi:hypothetical protein